MRVGVADAEVSEGHGYLGVTFGKTDPQFQMDLGFFVFTLPWLTFVIAYLSMALVIGALVAAFTHYVSGGLHFQGHHYVEPIYVQAKSASAYPLNRAVIAAYGDKLAWSTTLDGALDALFGGNAGASSGDNTPTTPPGTPTTPPPPGETANNPALTPALAEAQKALNDGDAALKAGDFTKYGEAQTRLKAAIAAAVAADPGPQRHPDWDGHYAASWPRAEASRPPGIRASLSGSRPGRPGGPGSCYAQARPVGVADGRPGPL